MAGHELPPPRRSGNASGRANQYPVGYQSPAGTGYAAGQGARGRPGSATDVFPRPSGRNGTTGLDGSNGSDAFHGFKTRERQSRHAPGGGGGRRIIDYPRQGRTGWQRWVPSWKLVAGLIGTGFVLGVLLFAVAYATIDIPKTQVSLPQTTVFTYSDGKTELGRLATQNRQNIGIAQVPSDVQHAVLAAEDRTFYTNRGVSATGIVRAAWSNARGNATQGGSTITQQYVKNTFHMSEHRTVTAKLREFVVALKINKAMKKPDVFEDYLNTIYFGRGAYGIQAAAQAYFHRDVGKLTVAQAAYLAGAINSPSLADDPTGDKTDKARASFRMNVVLNAMAQEKWITPEQRQAARFPHVYPMPQTNSMKGQRGYLVKMAQAEAAKAVNVSPDQIGTGGYRIQTTFRKGMMADAERAVKATMPADTPSRTKGGLAAINPDTGAIWAIYGGKDYLKDQFNQATQARPQGGSTFKAFGLLAALDDGVSLFSRFSGQSPMTIDGHPFHNFDNENPGTQNLLYATQQSVNTIYLQLNKQVGTDKTREAAKRAGLPVKKANMKGNLSNVLGDATPTAVEMASAYGTFADGGTPHAPYSVRSISEIGTKRPLWPGDNKPTDGDKPAFDKQVIDQLTYALQKPIQGGTGAYAMSLGRPAAGKTGTSSDHKSAWFVGYTPQISVAVNMYRNSKPGRKAVHPIPMKGFGGFASITGGSFPVRIWTHFTKDALDGLPVEQFDQPDLGGGEFLGTPAPVRPTAPSTTATEPGRPRPTNNNPTPTPPQTTLPALPTDDTGNGLVNGDPNGNGVGQQ